MSTGVEVATVAGVGPSAPAIDRGACGQPGRRLVAVAVTAMELLRPGSDLAQLAACAGRVDLLLAADDAPVPAPAPLGVLGAVTPAAPVPFEPLDLFNDAPFDPAAPDDAPDDDEASALDGVLAGLDEATVALDLPDLRLHRLGLSLPLGPSAESDVVAALSELVGFDPEPGVYCLAPAPAPGDPDRGAVERAVQRIARVYGLPLLRYRCHELTVVSDAPA